MVGYPKREKGTRRNHCIFWGKGEESVLIGAGMGQGDPPIVQANNKRSARQYGLRRLFAPRGAHCKQQYVPPWP